MNSTLFRKLAFTGYPNETELLEAGGDRLFEVDSLRQPGKRMLVALAEDGTKDYPVYDPDKKKVKWTYDDRFGKKFKSEVKKHMAGEVEEAETPKEEQEATNDPSLRKAARMGKCRKCHQERSLNRDGVCHQCEQDERDAESEKTASRTKKAAPQCPFCKGTRISLVRRPDKPGKFEYLCHDCNRKFTLALRQPEPQPEPQTVEPELEPAFASAKRAYKDYQCPFCHNYVVSLVGIMDDQEIFECEDCGRKFPMAEKVEVPPQPAWQPTFPAMASAKRAGLVDQIRPGDRVTITVPSGMGRNGQEYAQRTGRAVMRSSTGGWVLNMGGPHGTPGLADEDNIVKVTRPKQAARFETREEMFNRSEADPLGFDREVRGIPEDDPGEDYTPTNSKVYDLRPIIEDMRRGGDEEDTEEWTDHLISLSKDLGARALLQAARHYGDILERMKQYSKPGSTGWYVGANPIPPRTQRALDRAWKRVEAEYVNFVR